MSNHSSFDDDVISLLLLCDMTDASNYEFIDDIVHKNIIDNMHDLLLEDHSNLLYLFQMQTDQVRKWTGNPMTSD